MPVHVTTSTTQTITGNKTFTGLVSSSTGFTFPDGTTQTSAFTGVTIPPSDRLNNGTVQVVLSSDNNLIFPGGGYIGSQYGAAGWIVTPPAAGGLASADGEQYIQINNGQGIFIGTNWPTSSHEWAFGRDGGLTFPDSSVQFTAFTGGFVPLSGGDINGNLTINGALSVTTLCAASANIAVVNITQYELSGFTVSGDLTVSGTLSTDNPIYVGDRSSNNWNDVFTTVQSNSSTAWNYQGTDVKNLTANWQSTFNTVSSTSANWNDTRSVVQTNSAQWATDIATDAGVRSLTSNWQNTYSTVQNNSASNWNYQGADVKALTANWQTSYTVLTSTSADWNNTRSVVQSNSAQWATDSTTDTEVRALTSNWQNTYSTVQSNSATTWNYQGTDVKNLTANWQNTYIKVSSQSANNDSVYNTVNSYSATIWNPAGNYLPLSGGIVSGNLSIFGNLSCNGTQTFQNTIFSTTSAVSVIHVGSGPALWIGNNGTGDIASFYDIDENIEILHVGGNNGSFPNVGVKTSTPNVDFTVNGEISAASTIYSLSGNSNQWNSAYSTVQTNSATAWNYQGTDVKNLTANWQNTYNTVSSTSANWNDTRNTVQSNSAQWAIDNSTDTGVRELTSNWQSSYTALTSTSANWNDTRNTVQNNSATTWNYQGTDVKSLTSSWQNTYTTFSAQSANNLSVYSTVNANSATWGAGGGGGLTIFSEVSSVTSPNNTIPTFGLSAKSLSADVDFAIIPKGSGALLAQIPDGSYVGGNKRGLYATDWQRFRAVASQVASSAYATIGGGISNTASGEYSTIGGGGINIASSDYATVGGGTGNTASSAYATIGGGTGNTASGTAATIGGGENNIASSDYATIGSGANNTASGEYATIGGGANNTASGANSFIAGGFENNTNNQANTFILGSNIIAPSADYTYVNNLSSQADIRVSSTIYSASGNSNQWNSTYSTVNANSATWGTGGGSFIVEDANTIIGLSMFL